MLNVGMISDKMIKGNHHDEVFLSYEALLVLSTITFKRSRKVYIKN